MPLMMIVIKFFIKLRRDFQRFRILFKRIHDTNTFWQSTFKSHFFIEGNYFFCKCFHLVSFNWRSRFYKHIYMKEKFLSKENTFYNIMLLRNNTIVNAYEIK